MSGWYCLKVRIQQFLRFYALQGIFLYNSCVINKKQISTVTMKLFQLLLINTRCFWNQKILFLLFWYEMGQMKFIFDSNSLIDVSEKKFWFSEKMNSDSDSAIDIQFDRSFVCCRNCHLRFASLYSVFSLVATNIIVSINDVFDVSVIEFN